MGGSLGRDGAAGPQLWAGCARLLVPPRRGDLLGLCWCLGQGGAVQPSDSLGGPGPSIPSGPGIRSRLWVAVTVSPVTNRREKGLGTWKGQRHAQGITGWKPSPAQRKFQGNGELFSSIYIIFFLQPILLPSTDLYFIHFQFSKSRWEALRAVAGVPQPPLGTEPPPPIPTLQRLDQPSIPKLSWPRTAASLPQTLMNHWNGPWGH